MQHPDNYKLEIQEREIERKVKDVVDKREIGVIEEAQAEADKVYDATVKGDTEEEEDSGSHRITLKKGFNLEARDGLVLKLVKDTKFEVVGATTPEAIAGEVSVYPALYGAIRDDLAHDEEVDLGGGKKVKRRISYGAFGVKTIDSEEVSTGKEKVDTSQLASSPGAGVDTDSVLRRAESASNANAGISEEAKNATTATMTTRAFDAQERAQGKDEPQTKEGGKAATAKSNAKDESATEAKKTEAKKSEDKKDEKKK